MFGFPIVQTALRLSNIKIPTVPAACFVNNFGQGIATVRDAVFALVACVLNTNPNMLEMVGAWGLQQTAYLPVQPFQCSFGQIGFHPPSVKGLRDDCVWNYTVPAQVSVAG